MEKDSKILSEAPRASSVAEGVESGLSGRETIGTHKSELSASLAIFCI